MSDHVCGAGCRMTADGCWHTYEKEISGYLYRFGVPCQGRENTRS
jgi:hypothetical protein